MVELHLVRYPRVQYKLRRLPLVSLRGLNENGDGFLEQFIHLASISVAPAWSALNANTALVVLSRHNLRGHVILCSHVARARPIKVKCGKFKVCGFSQAQTKAFVYGWVHVITGINRSS